MSTTLVVYESKYGLTEQMARDLGRVLGPARVCRATDLASVAPGAGVCHEALTAATFVVVVAPVYRHRPDQRIIDFVMGAQEWLRARRVALVCVGLATSAGAVRTYLEPLSSVLGASVVWTGGLGGRVALSWLDTADRQEIEASGELRGHRGLDDLDSFSAERSPRAALAIKAFASGIRTPCRRLSSVASSRTSSSRTPPARCVRELANTCAPPLWSTPTKAVSCTW